MILLLFPAFDKLFCDYFVAKLIKEMHIVRYADNFRIFCQNKDSAERTLIAVTKWLKERLRLDVSPEKTRVVNLNKHYSEFLGIKMRLTKKKNKLVVQSRVSEKAVERIKAEAKQKIKNIARPPKGMTEALSRYKIERLHCPKNRAKK